MMCGEMILYAVPRRFLTIRHALAAGMNAGTVGDHEECSADHPRWRLLGDVLEIDDAPAPHEHWYAAPVCLLDVPYTSGVFGMALCWSILDEVEPQRPVSPRRRCRGCRAHRRDQEPPDESEVG